MKVVTRQAALRIVLAGTVSLVVPSSVVSADSPAQAQAYLSVGASSVTLAVARPTWTTDAAATVSLAPATAPLAAATIASDGKWHRVDIGGRRLAITCQGTGSPAVILEHGIGYGVDSRSWPTVESGVAKSTRVCRYDRAFLGHSDSGTSGRSMPDLAADLRALLKAAGIPGPYILVGHSFGGLTVRYYALVYPKDVIGMVLVDGSPPSAMTNLDLSSERLNRTKVLSQLKLLKSLGSIPLVVVTRGIDLTSPWRAAQEDMVELSRSGRQVFATKSDHWIQLRQPDVVIRQIETVINTIRRRT